jgi:adenylylsulfate reductase subunit B
MAIHVDDLACDGCSKAPEPLCVRDCPGDLLFIDGDGKAAIVDNRECWDCAACLKVCPREAISMQLTSCSLVQQVTLHAHALAQKTLWSIRLSDGLTKTYETPGPGCAPFAPNL